MLTHNDVHLIVGILSKMTTPQNVSITLGDMIHDHASSRNRDVDITISYKNSSGNTISFVGIEVKDEKRKLGSPMVEQLCMKFKDMPSIKKGGIVSASGFTGPAIKKAKYHGVNLFELRKWNFNNEIDHVKFDENFRSIQRIYQVVRDDSFTIIFEGDMPKECEEEFSSSTEIYELKDGKYTPMPLKTAQNNIKNSFLKLPKVRKIIDNLPDDELFEVDNEIEITVPFYINLCDKFFPIKHVHLKCACNVVEEEMKFELKCLVPLQSQNHIGVVVGEDVNGNLHGIAAPTADRTVRSFVIPIDDRLKEKIHKIKI